MSRAPGLMPEPRAAADCGFGTGGTDATTICWLDMSTFDPTLAQTAAGQPMTVAVTPSYSVSFTVHLAPGPGGLRPVTVEAFPTWSGTPIGNTVYVDTPGKPALYQELGRETGSDGIITLDGITVTGPGGGHLTGYGFVTTDAESTNAGEELTFRSNVPVKELATVAPSGYAAPCGGGLTGLGTTTVACTGDAAPNTKVGDLVTYTDAPSTVSADLIDAPATSRQGVAFGVLISKVDLSKQIVNPISASDAFKIAISDAAGNVVASADTGGTATATTGTQAVLAGAPSASYTFAETADSGTNLGSYTHDWSCTDNGVADPALPSGAAGIKQSVPVAIGDDIACTITNTGPTPDPSIKVVKSASITGFAAPDTAVTYTYTVTNTGNDTLDPVTVTDPMTGLSAISCPRTSLAPKAVEACTATYSTTQADVDAGSVSNTGTATGISPSGAKVTSQSSVTIPAKQSPALTIVKSATPTTAAKASQVIDYSFLVTNTGNVTVGKVAVTDTQSAPAGALTSGPTCPQATLAPGASETCTGTYAVTTADLANGSVKDSAVAMGTSPGGTTVTSPSVTAKVGVNVPPAPQSQIVHVVVPVTG